jgi:hypothetical protein
MPENVRKCLKMPENASVQKVLQKSTELFEKMPEDAERCRKMPKDA